MPITYPISFPSNLGISSFKYGVRHAVGSLESPFSFTEQVVKFSGEKWEIQVTLPNMFRADAAAFNAFLLKLRGKYGTFLIGDPNGKTPRGSWGGTPLVKGAGQTGNELLIDGLPLSTNGVAKAGDWIQLGTGGNARLYMVLDDANSNGSGEATLLLSPSLRSSPADDQAVIYQDAVGCFRLAENYTPIDINSNSIYNITFRAGEALNGA